MTLFGFGGKNLNFRLGTGSLLNIFRSEVQFLISKSSSWFISKGKLSFKSNLHNLNTKTDRLRITKHHTWCGNNLKKVAHHVNFQVMQWHLRHLGKKSSGPCVSFHVMKVKTPCVWFHGDKSTNSLNLSLVPENRTCFARY